MPIVFGWLAGAGLARIALSRVVVTALVWLGISVVGYRTGAENVSPLAGSVLSVGLPLAVLAWALHRPAATNLAIWLLEGLVAVLFLLAIGAGLAAVVGLSAGLSHEGNLALVIWSLVIAAAAWGGRSFILHRVRTSHLALGERSVLWNG